MIDGWEGSRRLRNNPKTSGISIIALSAHALARARDQADFKVSQSVMTLASLVITLWVLAEA